MNTLASDNLRYNLLEKAIMTIEDMIRDKKNYKIILTEQQQEYQHYPQVN